MPWAAAAVVGAAVVGAAAQSDSSRKAAHAQQDATREAVAANQSQEQVAREDLRPYREAGYRALGQLESEIKAPTTAADAMSDPGYQFGLQQGQLALDRKAAAAGGRVSGAALKRASEYATNYATTGYNAAYQRRQDRLNRLSALAGIGQTATGTGVTAGAQSTNAISNLISGQGNANAANQLAQGNIWGNTGNQLAAAYQRYQQQQEANYNSAVGAGAGQVNPYGGSYESGAYTGGVDSTAALGWGCSAGQ